MKYCTECPNHRVVPDPDPTDWFCDDDCAVLCTLKKATSKDPLSNCGHAWEFKAVSLSCRPYQVTKESPVPSWCPLKKKTKKRK